MRIWKLKIFLCKKVKISTSIYFVVVSWSRDLYLQYFFCAINKNFKHKKGKIFSTLGQLEFLKPTIESAIIEYWLFRTVLSHEIDNSSFFHFRLIFASTSLNVKFHQILSWCMTVLKGKTVSSPAQQNNFGIQTA